MRLKLAMVVALAVASLSTANTVAAPATTPVSLTGVLAVIWGDSREGGGLPPRVDLYETDGTAFRLDIPAALVAEMGGLSVLNGEHVTVHGIFDTGALDAFGRPTFSVTELVPGLEASSLTALTGSKPWVIILCKFANKSVEPRHPAYFDGLYGSSFPGINHFWKEISYGAVNLDGTTVAGNRWVVLPYGRSHYVTSSGVNLQALTNDCTGRVNSSVDFSQFAGVGMMFNDNLDGYSWGGTTYLRKDGVDIIRATWAPPWSYANQTSLAHEVGHGFGLPHSSGPYDQTYDSPWDVMSAWPVCADVRRYGCIGVETIAYHRYILGWIPSSRIYVARVGSSRQITLERLAKPTNPSGSYLMARIPLPGSTGRFYTVEARRRFDWIAYDDYEEGLIGYAVVIHLVDTRRTDRVAQVVDGSRNGDPADSGSMWKVGERFYDATNHITITIERTTSTGFVITIRNGE